MQQIAKFEKVSPKRFTKDIQELYQFTDAEALVCYNNVTLPRRATTGSAGYDFICPHKLIVYPKGTAEIPTGVRVKIEEGWWLAVFPKSGLGFRYSLSLCNTVGVIDSDYYYSDNEGHIMVKLINHGHDIVSISAGQSFAQGIFLPFGVTFDDDEHFHGVRNGGFGSTEGATSKENIG